MVLDCLMIFIITFQSYSIALLPLQPFPKCSPISRHRLGDALIFFRMGESSFVAPPTFFTREETPMPFEYNDIFRLTNQPDRMNMNLAILATLLQGIPRRQPDTFMEPVIVRPTAEQIASTTTLTTAVADGTCAVCQDEFSGASERRTLNFCHHTFHRGCIDTWFQTNVHCPVCRHDIRITS